MKQLDQDFRHHLVNGLTGIRASEQILKEGYTYKKEGEEYVKVPADLKAELENIDFQLKRIFKALNDHESKL